MWRAGVALVLAVWVGVATPAGAPAPDVTPDPAPKPSALLLAPKGELPFSDVTSSDCPLYNVHGELQGVKRHGQTWYNDGSRCEICRCLHGEKSCLYHYCNVGPTEVFMTPPSGQPPLDDEEDFNDLSEGSGRLPDDFYKIFHSSEGAGGQQEAAGKKTDKDARDNETHHPISSHFCSPPCQKLCLHGYKVDEMIGCRKCKCHKCASMRRCNLQCPGGLAQDYHGCRICQCQSPKLAVFTASHDNDDFVVEEGVGIGVSGGVYVTANTDPPCNTTRVSGCSDGHRMYPVGARWVRGPCVSCSCIAHGYTQCNITQCPRAPCPDRQDDTTMLLQAAHPCCPPCTDPATSGHSHQNHQHEGKSTSWEPLDRLPATHQHSHTSTPDHLSQHRAASDGTTKSAVQTLPVEWTQLCLTIVPLVLVFLLVAALIFYYWRRYHRDKYDINAYRPAETEKLRPVKTPDDQFHVRHV
ncbi:cysteine-rich motor neuron 1 protein isoform X2 [Procambarus clarkii]|uniref:cysteine-rich motor neuron 1 protein isoform X2 n=1 Tax=Procambarus clarkii TaxID=6728 RepID=UPI001E674F91|nr:cysteine-rich motor neuron 1 protein-like isoform X2 [Procambarus clarkii]